MYPFFRMGKELWVHRKAGALGVNEAHVSTHICWPWDLDFWFELNNGRTLTLFDLGRIPLARRIGLISALKKRRWGLTIAGVSVRYRRRIRAFERVEMRSRAVGWDARFLYLEQTLWNGAGECTTQALYRTAVTGKNGIVPPADVMAEIEFVGDQPTMPEWVNAWIAADAIRPWPPERA